VPAAVTPKAEGATPPEVILEDPAVVATLNRQAAILSNVYFPAQILASLGLEEHASVTAARLFLARFREEAGQAADSVEKVLLDQLAVAHLKIGELYALSSQSTNIEFKKMYNNAAARLLGGVCQLVATLAAYRASARPRQKQPEVEAPEGGKTGAQLGTKRRKKTPQ
jgi:hypothetical protein